MLGWGTGFGLGVPSSSLRCGSWKLLGSFIYPLLRLQSHLAFPIVPGETQPSAGAAGPGQELCGSGGAAQGARESCGCGVPVPGYSLWAPSASPWAQPCSGKGLRDGMEVSVLSFLASEQHAACLSLIICVQLPWHTQVGAHHSLAPVLVAQSPSKSCRLKVCPVGAVSSVCPQPQLLPAGRAGATVSIRTEHPVLPRLLPACWCPADICLGAGEVAQAVLGALQHHAATKGQQWRPTVGL